MNLHFLCLLYQSISTSLGNLGNFRIFQSILSKSTNALRMNKINVVQFKVKQSTLHYLSAPFS